MSGIKRNKFTGAESNQITTFLERAFVRLEAWFNWFNTAQKGNVGFFFLLCYMEISMLVFKIL